MKTNLFEEFQLKKKKVRNLADAALDKGWLSMEEHSEIVKKLDDDILTIGVIGQMKCGKSTFLNAFLFNDTVLPVSTKPMTAALSVITYGAEKNIVAEFYTPEDWTNLKMQAERQLDEEVSYTEKEIQKSARELYDKSASIINEIQSLLGKTKTDKFENLYEYVGADGKYVSITKCVTIHCPVEWLKGVEIVDTPGLNDPVVSRERRTQEFLKKADVVLMLLAANRAFDATDKEILFEMVRKVGVGKILLGINKYDLLIDRESEEEIRSNVEVEIQKACREPKYRDDLLLQEVMRGVKPIVFSANMALMAKMPIEKVYDDQDLRFHFNESCKPFKNEKQSQSQMLRDSLIEDLENAVRELVEKFKADILIKKPTNYIFQLAKNRHDKLDGDIKAAINTLKNLKTPDNELAEKLAKIKKAQRKIERRIDNAVNDLSDEYDDITSGGIEVMTGLVFEAKEDCMRISGNARRNEIGTKLNSRIDLLNQLELPKALKDYKKDFIQTLNSSCEDFADKVEEQLEKFIDDCDDIKEAFRSAIGRGANSIKNGASEEELDLLVGEFENQAISPISKIIFPIFIYSILEDWKEDVNNKIQDHFRLYDFSSLEKATAERKQKYLELLKTEATRKLLGSLVNILTEALESEEKKEKLIEETEAALKKYREELKVLDNQIDELRKITNS